MIITTYMMEYGTINYKDHRCILHASLTKSRKDKKEEEPTLSASARKLPTSEIMEASIDHWRWPKTAQAWA
jgi:hypothetical protein